jgi:flagellar capping protein FliD
VGIRVAADGQLVFHEGDFDTLAAKDSDTVKDIFTRSRPLDDKVRLADFANGSGVSTSAGGSELRIWKRDGTSFDVDLTGSLTVRDLLSTINHATGNGGAVTASISTSGRSIALTDSTTGTTAFRVEPLNGSGAYQQLGLDRPADTSGGGTITGRDIDLKDDPGVARRLFDVVTTLSDAQNGVLQRRADAFQSEIDDFNKRITTMQQSITAHEQQLRQKFAQLEVLMGQNQNTLQRLAAGLGGVVAGAANVGKAK